jgi:hypothetical protein
MKSNGTTNMNIHSLPRNKPSKKAAVACSIILWIVASLQDVRAQQTLTYDLLPDSTITPVNGGPSQPLTGSFSWLQYTPSFVSDCYTFFVTDLNFQAPGFSLTLTSGSPDSTTPSDPNGQTDMNAYVNWAGGPPGTYLIGGFNQGTCTGPATAPTGLKMTEGFGPASGGAWQDYLYIDAVLVPEPSVSLLGVVGFGALFALRSFCQVSPFAGPVRRKSRWFPWRTIKA